MVVLVGDGSGALSTDAAPVFLQRRSLTTGAVISTLPLPTSASGANQPLTLSGTAISEGALARSADGRTLALGGYTSPPGTTSVATTTTPRVVALTHASDFTSMTTDTSTTLGTSFSANTIRAAVSEGAQVWAAGSSDGVVLTTAGATTTPTQVVSAPTNVRALGLFGNNLWVSTATGSSGVHRVGLNATGAPTSLTTVYLGAALTTPYGFAVFEDYAPEPGLDLMYIADDTAGLIRAFKSGGSWQLDDYWTGTVRHLSCTEDGADIVCLATNSTDIFLMRDVNRFSFGRALTSIATAPANTAFRGVAFMPVP